MTRLSRSDEQTFREMLKNTAPDSRGGFGASLASLHGLLGEIDALRGALGNMTNHYAELVNSGDCGNWNPEEESVVIAARALLPTAPAAKPEEPDPWG